VDLVQACYGKQEIVAQKVFLNYTNINQLSDKMANIHRKHFRVFNQKILDVRKKALEIRKQQISNTEKSIEPLLSRLQGVPLEVIVAALNRKMQSVVQ
jgi:hypothetical protein